MICVYESTCTDFSNNGLGLVSPQSCTVTETLNGEWELTLVHPIDDQGKWGRLTEGNILRVPVPAAITPQVDLVIQNNQSVMVDVLIYKVQTSSGKLNLRSGTGTKYKRLGQYKKGTEIIVLNRTTSSWYEVTCPDGKHGYMSSQYLEYVRTDQQERQTGKPFRNETIEARQLRDQPFRIYRVVPDLNKITVYARHVFYDLLDNMVKQLRPASANVGASVMQSLSQSCLSEHDFTFYSDLETTASEVLLENKNPVECILGEEGLAVKYEGELARDWFDVFLVKRVGHDTDIQIREKKNLLGVSYDVDETNVVTRIMPTGQDVDGNLLYLPELYIDSPNINAYAHPKWYHLAVSEAKEVTEGTEDNPQKAKEQCYTEMRKAVQAEFDKGCDLPTVTLKVDFVDVANTEEYKQYLALTEIFLGDAVRVVAPRIGVSVSMRMTQYTYDCLTKKYTSVTLGTVSDTVESSLISIRQLAAGSITGAKLAIHSVGAGQLQAGAVGSLQIKNAAIGNAHIQNAAIGTAHIQNASIVQAHITDALIETLNANAITAVTAKIEELVAGSITTDELYASIAAIALAQITTANIINANIDWAKIETLVAASAEIAKAEIGSANIDWAQIKDLITDTAIITEGVAGELYIARLAVTEANMVSLTVGELVVKGEDGCFYALSVDENGEVITTLKQVANDDVKDLSINAGEKIIEGTVTAATLNAQDIFANSAIIKSLIAANLDVDTLFAREATINALNAMDISSNTYLKLMVSSEVKTAVEGAVEGKADQTDLDKLAERVSSAELKLTDDSIVSAVTSSETYKQDQKALSDAIDGKADADEVSTLTDRVAKAEEKITPDAIVSTVTSSAVYQQEMQNINSFIDSKADAAEVEGLSNRVETAESNIDQQAGQIALKVNTATYNADKVYRGTTAPASPTTNMLWLDTSVSPNLLKRYNGSTWVVAGAEEVKTSGLYIGSNNVAITTENFLLQLLDPADNENVLMEMSANGEVGFKQLYADTVISGSVAAAYDGPDMLDIDPTFTGTSDSYFRSLGDAVKAVNNKFLPYDVYIFLPYNLGDIYEPAGTYITGVTGPGRLSIFGGDGILHSYISVMGCSAHIYFYGLSMREIRPLDGSNRNPYLVELTMNRFVEFNSCVLDANSTTYDSVYCKSSHVVLRNTSLYNALQGLEVYMGWGYVRDCKGSCSWSMVCYAGYIIAHGTVPGGSRSTGENGQLFANGVTVDYGSATAPVTPETTGYFYASTTKTYRGGWRSDTLDVIQGLYSDSGYKSSLNWNYGCMWFSSLKSTLSGKTVKSATLTLHRKTGSGASSAKTVYLCAISNTSASGSPSIVTNFGGIGKIGRNATVTFSIPTDAVQGLANGTYGGLCLYETKYNFGSSTYSSCYMRMSGTDTDSEPYLTVVYS